MRRHPTRGAVLALALLCAAPASTAPAPPIRGTWVWEAGADGAKPSGVTTFYMHFGPRGSMEVTTFDGFEGLEDGARYRLRGERLHMVRERGSTLGWPVSPSHHGEVPASYDCAAAFGADGRTMLLSGCGIAGTWARHADLGS